MDYEKQVTVAEQPQLTEDDQSQIVRYVTSCWDKGKQARKDEEEIWERAQNTYDCIHEKGQNDVQALEWRSRAYLPWCYEAVESHYSYMMSTMLPRDDQIFSLEPRTRDDAKPNKTVEEYIDYMFEENNFRSVFGKALKQAEIKGPTCIKAYWLEDTREYIDYQEVPVFDDFGNIIELTEKPVKQSATVFSGVYFDAVDMRHFVFYPTFGDINKTTRIHETYRHLEELLSAAPNLPYFNLDRLSQDDETKQYLDSPNQRHWTGDSYDYKQEREVGLNIKEAWIHRVKIGEKVYNNMVATVVNDRHLIRFQPNPYDNGMSPFIYCDGLISNGFSLYGSGLISKVIPLQHAANYILNAFLDESKLNIYKTFKWWDDSTFDPYNAVRRPGGMVEFADAASAQTNMIPVEESMANMQQAITDLQVLKNEFEEATVPKVVKGLIEIRNQTATESTQQQNNASNKMHVQAQHLNQRILKPAVEMAYTLIRARAQYDEQVLQDIARVTVPATITIDIDPMTGQPLPEPVTQEKPLEQMMAELPPMVPLNELDVRVVGYHNTLQKQQQLVAIKEYVSSIAQTPSAPYIDWEHISTKAAHLMSLKETDLLLPEKEREQVKQQIQQQQQMTEQMAMALQQAEIEAKQAETQFKQAELQQDGQIEQMKFQLEMQKLELEREKLALEREKANIEALDKGARLTNDLQQPESERDNGTEANKDTGSAETGD